MIAKAVFSRLPLSAALAKAALASLLFLVQPAAQAERIKEC